MFVISSSAQRLHLITAVIALINNTQQRLRGSPLHFRNWNSDNVISHPLLKTIKIGNWNPNYYNFAYWCSNHLLPNQGCTNRCSLAAGLQGNEERMRKWRGNGEEMEREWGNGEKMRKWREDEEMERIRKLREIHSPHFLIFSLFPPSLFIFYIRNCLIFCKMLNMALLSWMSQKT